MIQLYSNILKDVVGLIKKQRYVMVTESKTLKNEKETEVNLVGLYKIFEELDDCYVILLNSGVKVTISKEDCRLASKKEVFQDKMGTVAVVTGVLLFLGMLGLLALYNLDISHESIDFSGMLASPLHYVLFIIGVIIMGILVIASGGVI